MGPWFLEAALAARVAGVAGLPAAQKPAARGKTAPAADDDGYGALDLREKVSVGFQPAPLAAGRD